LVELGGSGVRVCRLGKDRAGEIRLTRFLHNPAVTVTEMVATAAARTSTRVTGRHVLAIQDTTMVRSAAEGIGVALHPLIAVDAVDGTLFGLLDARFFIRQGGQRNERRERDLAQKESGRWLEAAQRAAELAAVGAACVTVVSDREGDIYEDFADKPSAVEMLVRAGQVTVVNFVVDVYTIERPIVVEAYADSILDPTLVASVQRIGGDELRRFPVTTLEEAVSLSAGAVGESYRGGRLGQQAFVLDGLGVKNQLDASTGPLGVRIPPDMLTEASLATNGFSARYGQAVSGLINVVTKDGGDHWTGRAAYETDRLLTGGADLGQDRAVVSVDGPLGGGAGLVAVIDADGRLDADPVNAPLSGEPRDPRNSAPALLPHNSGERYDAAVKVRIPLGAVHTLRLFALRSVDQRLLFDPAYKYDTDFAPARRVTGDLFSAHVQRATNNFTADLRAGYFARAFTRGALTEQPTYGVGAFTGQTFHFIGEDIARRQDTALARAPVAGFTIPDWSERTPWGVPGFFRTGGSDGEIAWNRFREVRGQADFSIGGPRADF